MSSPAPPLLHIAPLDGESGYLRWKESVLLRLYSLGVARVLSNNAPTPTPDDKQWSRDDALCRGHILATLSDRLLPVYAHHASARAVWRAVARTYELDTQEVSSRKALAFRYAQGRPVLEQLALLQALVTTGGLEDYVVFRAVKEHFRVDLALEVRRASPPPSVDDIWEMAHRTAVVGKVAEANRGRNAPQTTGGQGSDSLDSDDSVDSVDSLDYLNPKRRRPQGRA